MRKKSGLLIGLKLLRKKGRENKGLGRSLRNILREMGLNRH
jgi:hypothetical protein